MLKRLFVSSSSFIKGKNKIYYWIPPKKEELWDISFIKENYDIRKLLESQEIKIKEINNQLTNNKKFIENI